MADEDKWGDANEAGGGDFGKTPRWQEEAKTDFEKENTEFLGNIIEGKYVNKMGNVGAKGANMYQLDTEAHGRVSIFGTTVLDDKFEKGSDGKGIPVGSEVKIEHTGKEKSKDGNDYHTFKVLFLKPQMEEAGGGDKDKNEDKPF